MWKRIYESDPISYSEEDEPGEEEDDEEEEEVCVHTLVLTCVLCERMNNKHTLTHTHPQTQVEEDTASQEQRRSSPGPSRERGPVVGRGTGGVGGNVGRGKKGKKRANGAT